MTDRIISCAADMLGEIGVTSEAAARKAIYRATPCGAWLRFDTDGVAIGSIVEGSDAEIGPVILKYPFTAGRFWEAADGVNEAASAAFEEAHAETEGLEW